MNATLLSVPLEKVQAAIELYLREMADSQPEEGMRMAQEFGDLCRLTYVKRAAEINSGLCRELIRYHTQKEIAEMFGVSEGRVWQWVNR